MPLPLKIILGVIVSYLLGSIPTAYLFGRLRGLDIRQYGSGNVGATNAFRVLGKGLGTVVLLVDILKGVVATTMVADIFGLGDIGYRVVLGLVVVVGHNWTVFLQFKGGKGIATSLGVLIGLTIKIAAFRPMLLISLLVWAAVFLLTGFVSLASIVAATILPFLAVMTDQPFAVITLGIIFCVFVVIRHRLNIKRLLSGKEHRVRFSSQK